ncbi:MAG TPA: sugar phosphate isomerase/epimerase [Gemmatimonadaceae bacterium]|nr:sugar phosphate isomerase/epimerase [Gemmatimonadaceae bacterium]
MVPRREFLRRLGGALPVLAAGGAGVVAWHPAPARRLTRIGLQLYAVRDAMRRDPEGTLAAVRGMGYADVELLWTFGNFGRAPRQVLAALRDTGLRAPSAHIAPETLLAGWSRSLEIAVMLRHEYLIVPSLPEETRQSLDAWRLWADRFNRAGEAARKVDVWLAFHNEPSHQAPIDGVVPYDLFIERTQSRYVKLQLDVGNMVMGGGDPEAYVRQHASRYASYHLKDVARDGMRDTALGTGRIDFRRLLASIPDVHRARCFVEQEGAEDSMASARANYAYLSRLEF